MKRESRNVVAGLLVGCWLGLAGPAAAGPYVNLMQPHDCPPTHYSALHVLTPVFYRWAAWCQGPRRYTFAKILNPDIQPKHYKLRYHCPSINPLQFELETYPGLNGNPPASLYPTPPPRPQVPREYPPQELPQPREEKRKPPEKLPLPREEPDKPN